MAPRLTRREPVNAIVEIEQIGGLIRGEEATSCVHAIEASDHGPPITPGVFDGISQNRREHLVRQQMPCVL